MGADCALFAVLNSLLSRPLPYLQPERLVEVSFRAGLDTGAAERLGSFDSDGAFLAYGFSVNGTDGPRNHFGFRVSPGLLGTLGARPLFGGIFSAGDES